MGKLEELRNLVSEMFSKAEDKSAIEALSVINKAVDDVEAEHNKLIAENKELLKDYKELVVHTSFKDSQNQPQDTISGQVGISIDEALQKALENLK